jgi:hypothetical protein
MNERTRELAEQALQLVADKHTNGDESRLNTDSYHVKDLIQAKFAELIVRECAKKGFDIFDEEPDAPASDLQFYVRDRIKEHFGVEE